MLSIINVLSSRPFVGASQGVSLAHSTCATTASSKATGERTVLFSPASGHPTATPQPTRSRKEEPALHSSAIVNDKYLDNDQFSICFHDNDHLESFLEQVQYFENCQSYDNFKGVKGRLASHVKYWENIGACPFVLGTIKNGYVIPFIDTLFNMYHTNNRSARQNTEFVTKSIEDLVQIGCVIKVPFQPYVVNPLSVATEKSGKKRLILDMSQLNKHIKREKIKFEDWKIAIQYFDKNMYVYLFKFDLKSGYFHIDICPQQQTFLGFHWEGQFYCYTVLAFGITTGPYIFTKCLRPLVKFWHENGIKVVLYLDDGFGLSPDENTSRSLAQVVGRIISMTPVIGNVARIMSKFCYMEIESRIGWDNPISGYKPVEVLSELKFWLEKIDERRAEEIIICLEMLQEEIKNSGKFVARPVTSSWKLRKDSSMTYCPAKRKQDSFKLFCCRGWGTSRSRSGF
ncbi:unnamed protein product [Mytilus coruscus]|uniref:Reverse transcriptase domain-containing protein n=1 Tax=Mytilus coruscus TaxID=42192 RepID=A0A6J8C0I1_MYTCO|nr:unnamed protein product [Mytilus coruscus]